MDAWRATILLRKRTLQWQSWLAPLACRACICYREQMLSSSEVLDEFKKAEALLEGHFVLRSGLHSRRFFQCAMLLQHPQLAACVCEALASKLSEHECATVISPALGGIIVGHEVARTLGKRHIFAEKEEGRLVLRRGFKINPGEKFIVAEDVVTRGGRVQETIDIVRARGAEVCAVGVLVDRSGDNPPSFGCPFVSLLKLDVQVFAPDKLPADLLDTPALKPGSR